MASEVSSSSVSSLNPNAALFIPSGSQSIFTEKESVDDDTVETLLSEWDVEDFSPEWWSLVQTSPEFCEFWLQGYEATDAEDLLSFFQHEDFKDAAIDQEHGVAY